MLPQFEIRTIPLTDKWFRNKAEAFISSCGLSLDSGLEYLAGIYDYDDKLVGTGGLCNNIIKCLAVSKELRGMDVSASLVSHLYSVARAKGSTYVTLFTKPDNESKFKGLGFNTIGKSSLAVMMQSSSHPLQRYIQYLKSLPRSYRNGAIVMNVNPLTCGHLYLIKRASEQVDCLTIIPVADNPATLFSYSERISMLKDACSALPNVSIAEGSEYAISASTFPSYFLKKKDDATLSHIELDLDIFTHLLASALNVSVRFAGTEPNDSLTALYNEQMKKILPLHNIEFIEIPRMEADGTPVSASNVRRHIADSSVEKALRLVPLTSIPYILSRSAVNALRLELDLTPKPGLVDRKDSGSHKDMDYELMSLSINTLQPYFTEIAKAGILYANHLEKRISILKQIGIEAEKEMLKATGNINTHRGAIFSSGLMVSAAAALLAQDKTLTADTLSNEISSMAMLIHAPNDTHGALVTSKYGKGGAVHNARSGYKQLFDLWLQKRREWKKPDGSDTDRIGDIKTLLLIISSLHDSNTLYRVGERVATDARNDAKYLLDNFSLEATEELNDKFISQNISHGGAADMLALTFLADSLLSNNL